MRPNSKNRDSLLEFFEEYRGLTNNQLAIVADVAPCTIVEWKRKCGIISSTYQKPQKRAKGPIPEDWDNKKWFEQAYKSMGLHAIALLIGKGNNWQFVAKRLKRYGIERKSHSERVGSTNPCCDSGWLHYYYSDRKRYLKWCRKNRVEPCDEGGQKLTLHECGALAGVSHQTIANWLSLFKIKTRDLSESKVGKSTKRRVKPPHRRSQRDRFFEQYRSGSINIIVGSDHYSNGTKVGKEETVSKRFNRNLRGTPPHTPS
jgi:hypothetical protein